MKILMISRATLLSSPGGDTIQITKTAEFLEKLNNVKIDIKSKSLFYFYVYQFSKKDEIIMHRVSGWMSKALQLINRKNIVLKVENFEENNETVFKITCSWD